MSKDGDMNDAQLADAIAKLFDDDLLPEEFEALDRRLRDDADARKLYQECVWLENALDTIHATPLSRSLKRGGHPLRRVQRALGLAAAAALVIGAMLFFKQEPPARLRMCGDSVWTVDGVSGDTVSVLQPGSELEIRYGVAELALPRDVIAVVEAPARLTWLGKNLLRLDDGRGFFRVGTDARGFTVQTPGQRLVDLGTEFGVDAKSGTSEVKLQVFKGKVRVDPPSGEAGSLVIEAGHSVSLRGPQLAQELEHGSGSPFLQKLPAAIRLLCEEDFEDRLTPVADGDVIEPAERAGGWELFDGGVFNPMGDGRWYQSKALDDTSPSRGIIGAMRGPTLGFFCAVGADQKAIRPLGRIEADSRYTVSLGIGVRAEHPAEGEVFNGYTIRLKSGETTLASLSNNQPPGPFNSVTLVDFSWNSADLPQGVKAGDPLSLEVVPGGAAGDQLGYLDFDNIRVSVAGTE